LAAPFKHRWANLQALIHCYRQMRK
jgi:hypothetical protein